MDKEYDVGWCKPPKTSRFRKGASGNPKGRPKGARSVAAALEAALLADMKLQGADGKKTAAPSVNVFIQMMIGQASKGNMVAAKIISDILCFSAARLPALNDNTAGAAETEAGEEHDDEIIEQALERRDRSSGDGGE